MTGHLPERGSPLRPLLLSVSAVSACIVDGSLEMAIEAAWTDWHPLSSEPRQRSRSHRPHKVSFTHSHMFNFMTKNNITGESRRVGGSTASMRKQSRAGSRPLRPPDLSHADSRRALRAQGR